MFPLLWKPHLHILLTVIFLSVFCGGCTKSPTTTVVAKNAIYGSQRILVLPFSNTSDEKHLGKIATQICQEHYLSRGIKLINQGDLRIYLQRHHLFLSQLTDEASSQRFADLARELQITTLVKGTIISAEYREVQGERLPVISLQLELLNAANGKLIISSFLTGHGKDYRTLLRFGVLRTTTQLLNRMISEITDNWANQGVLL
jgi:hypothetical protein